MRKMRKDKKLWNVAATIRTKVISPVQGSIEDQLDKKVGVVVQNILHMDLWDPISILLIDEIRWKAHPYGHPGKLIHYS
jgi:hypothetical protein